MVVQSSWSFLKSPSEVSDNVDGTSLHDGGLVFLSSCPRCPIRVRSLGCCGSSAFLALLF